MLWIWTELLMCFSIDFSTNLVDEERPLLLVNEERRVAMQVMAFRDLQKEALGRNVIPFDEEIENALSGGSHCKKFNDKNPSERLVRPRPSPVIFLLCVCLASSIYIHQLSHLLLTTQCTYRDTPDRTSASTSHPP